MDILFIFDINISISLYQYIHQIPFLRVFAKQKQKQTKKLILIFKMWIDNSSFVQFPLFNMICTQKNQFIKKKEGKINSEKKKLKVPTWWKPTQQNTKKMLTSISKKCNTNLLIVIGFHITIIFYQKLWEFPIALLQYSLHSQIERKVLNIFKKIHVNSKIANNVC